MAYINPQLQIDQEQDAKSRQNQAAIGQGLINGLNYLEENRRRALDEKRQMETDGVNRFAREYALSKDGHSAEAIKQFMDTGDASALHSRNQQMAEAARAKAMADAELDRQFKQSQIEANRAKAIKDAKYQPPTGAGGVGGKGTVAEQAVDRSFGKTYDDFIVGGGYSKVDRGLKALKEVSVKLGNKNADLTGPVTGRMPEFIQSFTNPEAIQARDQVGTIIQDNLKSILGASYTEAEGERVIKRAYDPKLSEEANKKKLDGLINQMEAAAKAKLQAAQYYEQHGTMRGYKGTVINNVDDIFNQSGPSGAPDAPAASKPWEKYK